MRPDLQEIFQPTTKDSTEVPDQVDQQSESEVLPPSNESQDDDISHCPTKENGTKVCMWGGCVWGGCAWGDVCGEGVWGEGVQHYLVALVSVLCDHRWSSLPKVRPKCATLEMRRTSRWMFPSWPKALSSPHLIPRNWVNVKLEAILYQ